MPSKSRSTSRYKGPDRRGEPAPAAPVSRVAVVILAAIVVVITVLAADFVFGAITGSSTGSTAPQGQWVEQGRGGSWTDVSADRLATMLEHKDFTFVNVKTPYMGEIAGTDLYIPYDQIATRASDLPAAKNAKILVYCRSGNESRIAAQTLLDMGYTNVWNLDNGMNGWTESGRKLIQVAH